MKRILLSLITLSSFAQGPYTVEVDEVIWLSADDILDEIPWRGLAPFGTDRDWTEIPYPEQIGLAKYALEKSPHDPIEFICGIFQLKRRHQTTLNTFDRWIARVKE